MRKFSLVIGVLIGVAVFERPSSAQNLTFYVFESYLQSLRVEANIPGMSALVIQDGVVAWERGFGQQDVEGSIAASPDTPYPIGALSQAIGSSVLLRTCVDHSYAEVTDPVVRWTPTYPEPTTTIGQLLSHTAPEGVFRYSPSRLSALTGVVEECADETFSQLVAEDVFDRLVMIDSVPGESLASLSASTEPSRRERYTSILRRTAIPYRIVNRRPVRNTEVATASLGVSRGIVTSVRDLARFDLALDAHLVLAPQTRVQALSQSFSGSTPLPTGFGWFVQAYNGQPVVWQFGVIDNAYSSLIVKVPNRRLTFILLANSDGLSAPFALEAGDVTASIFARTFLRTFLP